MGNAEYMGRAISNLPKDGNADTMKAELRKTLEAAVSTAQSLSEEGAYTCAALTHWMRLEAYSLRDYKATLEVGSRLMKLWGAYYNVWSSYIAAARYCAPSDAYAAIRDLFEQAASQVVDFPDQVFTDRLQFEREYGTFQSWRELHRIQQLQVQKQEQELALQQRAEAAAEASRAKRAADQAELAGQGK